MLMAIIFFVTSMDQAKTHYRSKKYFSHDFNSYSISNFSSYDFVQGDFFLFGSEIRNAEEPNTAAGCLVSLLSFWY